MPFIYRCDMSGESDRGIRRSAASRTAAITSRLIMWIMSHICSTSNSLMKTDCAVCLSIGTHKGWKFFKKVLTSSACSCNIAFVVAQDGSKTLEKNFKKCLTIPRGWSKIVASPVKNERRTVEEIRRCSLKTKQCRNESSIWFKPDVHQEKSWWNIDCELHL